MRDAFRAFRRLQRHHRSRIGLESSQRLKLVELLSVETRQAPAAVRSEPAAQACPLRRLQIAL